MLLEAIDEIVAHLIDDVLRREDAADGGALLPRLLGHVAHHVLEEEVVRLEPGAASGPRTAAFRLSASTLTRTERPAMFGMVREGSPVSLDPVKASTSCPVR
ncbi:MAG: hypothetical protein U0359_19400 [Byssovorax sp.]